MSHRTRDRKDHYLPQAYLRGFIDPAQEKGQKPLWLFDVQQRKWKRSSAAEIGYIRGFYDFSKGFDASLGTADDSFGELERNFTLVLRELTRNDFENWRKHREFLLRFMQMIRVRSPLYFEQKRVIAKESPALVVEEVRTDGMVKVRPTEIPDRFIKNRTLTEMMDEIQKGSDWLNRFDWALRYSDSLSLCFFASDSPFVVTGPLAGQGKQVSWEALQHRDTLFFFPLCWRACIVGSPRSFNVETDKATPEFVNHVTRTYRANSKSYLVSPLNLDEMKR